MIMESRGGPGFLLKYCFRALRAHKLENRQWAGLSMDVSKFLMNSLVSLAPEVSERPWCRMKFPHCLCEFFLFSWHFQGLCLLGLCPCGWFGLSRQSGCMSMAVLERARRSESVGNSLSSRIHSFSLSNANMKPRPPHPHSPQTICNPPLSLIKILHSLSYPILFHVQLFDSKVGFL